MFVVIFVVYATYEGSWRRLAIRELNDMFVVCMCRYDAICEGARQGLMM